ncbi:hypothetical protein AWP49_05665 [Escherichia coli]|nr:hypothetical protein AWP49_05665 [Escherichia coli]OKX69647.1 hypothetical protein AWP95_12595 [Escherichia coli]
MGSRFSVIMQGSVLDKYGNLDVVVVENIKRVRRVFASSELILSTWEVSERIQFELKKLAEELCLIILYNKDPGEIRTPDNLLSSNINRLIVSTKNGIAMAGREFVVKIRTDSYFYDGKIVSNFLKILESDIDKSRDIKYSVFEHYVINCALFARDSRGYLPYLFHPGDICLVGTKQDVLSIFDVPLANESIFFYVSRAYFFSLMRYVPEQYIWVCCIKNKTGRLIYSGNDVYDRHAIELSERFYVNNFIVLSPEQLGFKWPKHKLTYKNKGLHSILTLNGWKVLYNKYNRRYFEVDYNEILVRKCVVIMMVLYMFVRTTVLKVPLLRKLAIKFHKFFYKRG